MRFSSVLLLPLAVGTLVSGASSHTSSHTTSTSRHTSTHKTSTPKHASSTGSATKHTSSVHTSSPSKHSSSHHATSSPTSKHAPTTAKAKSPSKSVAAASSKSVKDVTVTKTETVTVTASSRRSSSSSTHTSSSTRTNSSVSSNFTSTQSTLMPSSNITSATPTPMTSSNVTALNSTSMPSSNNATATTATTSGGMPTVVLDYCTVAAAAGNSSLGYYKYQNVRFAAVPTGTLRWAEPAWPPVETGVNNGTYASATVSCNAQEDCLYLDIWAPANSTGKSLPVMVWNFAGGYQVGSKTSVTPEGLFNLTTDFIFVAYNHRLGVTGIGNGQTYAHEGATSNPAVWDGQHAFQWVKKYISNFGGNPNELTAVGFSSGAANLLFQITRFGGHAEQLFDRAYIISPGDAPFVGHNQAEQFWQNVSTAVGCTGGHLDCMRNVSFSTLTSTANSLATQYNYQFQPRADGNIIPDAFVSELYQGHFNFSGPLVITHELHEANSVPWTGVNTAADVITNLRIFFPAITDDVIDEVLDLFPASNYASYGLQFADIRQSFRYTAHDLALTQALDNNTWNALVTLGAANHGFDQAYYWYTNYTLASGSVTPTVNRDIALKMQKYLMSFVMTGNPNTLWADDKLEWPLYSTGGELGQQIVFNDDDTFYLEADDLANEQSLFWNQALWY